MSIVSSRSLSRVCEQDKVVAGRNGREWGFLNEGSLVFSPVKVKVYLSGPLMFHLMLRKIALVGIP